MSRPAERTTQPTDGATRQPSRWRPDRPTLWLLLLFLLSLPLVTARVYGVDEIQYYAYLSSAWNNQDLDFRDDYTRLLGDDRLETIDAGALFRQTTPTGKLANFAGIGCALLWAPFFVAGDVIAIIGGWPRDGFSAPYLTAVCYGAAFYAFLGLLLLLDLARRELDDRSALFGVGLAWWATALPFYMYVTPPMSHATSFFAASLFVWAWYRWRDDGRASSPGPSEDPDLQSPPSPPSYQSPSRYLALGALLGVATLVREQNLLFGVLVALDLVQACRASASESAWSDVVAGLARSAGAFAIGLVLAMVPQLVVWFELFGSIGPPPLRVSFMQPLPTHLPSVLASSNHGLLPWHPVWIVGFGGLLLLARRRPTVLIPLVVAFGAQLWFLGAASNWSGGMAFGQRRLLNSLYVVALGAGEAVRRAPRALAVGVAALLIWLNLSLLIQFGSGMIPRAGGVSWRAVARNHVVEVPRAAADLLTRYLFDRDSLWQPSGAKPDDTKLDTDSSSRR